MRKPTRFGVYGLVAWTCSFCLSAATTLPQEARIASTNNLATEDLSPSALSAPSLQQLQEQNLAVLKAIEQLREDKEAALNRYTESISAQLNILKDAIIFQREQEMASARSSNRFIFTVAAVIGALAVLVMLVTALVPVWAVKRLAAARPASAFGSLFLQAHSGLWSGAGLALRAVPEKPPARLQPGKVVEELEQRVLALEKRTSQPQAVAQKPVDGSGKIVAAPARPETSSAKYSKSARVAITLGEGKALSFLPGEAALTRFHSFEVVMRKLKKLLRLARASKQH